MKKKGLIISTIVMVVVLIASLTTATYAWFTATATATISSMNIETSAAEGLQIAAVKYNDTGAPNAYNGDLTLSNYHWVVEGEENGYGSDLRLTPQATDGQHLLNAMYGTSGDGTTMFRQTSYQQMPSNTNPMIAAQENENYVALDFSLLATSDGTAYINQIYVNPAAGSKSGMAGSMRIALFTTAAGNPITTGTPELNKTLLYIPYGLHYTGATFATGVETNQYFVAAGNLARKFYDEQETEVANYTKGDAFTKPSGYEILSGEIVDDHYYKELTGDDAAANAELVLYETATATVGTKSTSGEPATAKSLQDEWTAAKTVYGTKQNTVVTGKQLSSVGNQIAFTSLTDADAAFKNEENTGIASLGTISANQVIYCRLVIWFEGESAACIQEFSGGGATVQINFSLQPNA